MRQEMSLRTPDPLCFSGGSGNETSTRDKEMTALGKRKKYILQVHIHWWPKKGEPLKNIL